MQEIWKTVPETDGFYEASTLGRIMRVKGRNAGRILCATPRASGNRPQTPDRYTSQKCTLSMPWGIRQAQYARIICETFNGPPPDDGNEYDVDHKNHKSLDHRPNNLRWRLATRNRGDRRTTASERQRVYEEFMAKIEERRAA